MSYADSKRYRVPNEQSLMENPKALAILSTQDTERKQTKHKKPNTEIYEDEKHGPHENPGMNPCAHEWKVVPASMIQPLSSINLGFIIK